MKRISGTVVLLTLAACKTDEAPAAKPIVPAPVTFVSGSRLKATFQEVDGVRKMGSWQDSQLGKLCTFMHGRCITSSTRFERTDLLTFDDAACTSQVVSTRGEVDAIVVRDPIEGCADITVHAVGERITPAQLYVRGVAGECSPSMGTIEPDGYVRVGAALAREAEPFVHAKEENDPSGGRIVARWRIAEDGAREIIGAWDTERNELVTRPFDSSGKRWFPARRAALIGDHCPGLATSFECEPKVVAVPGSACRDPDLFALGPPADTTDCRTGTNTGYQVLSMIPHQQFAEATVVEVGAGRIRLQMDARDDGMPLVAGGFFDTEGGITCGPDDIDGALRCAPSRVSGASDAFADASCTERAVVFNPGAAPCDAPPNLPRYMTLQSGGAVEVGGRISGAFQKNGGGPCIPFETSSSDSQFYRVAPLDPSRMPVMAVKTE